MTASLTALLPLAATPFLSEAGSAPVLAWIAAASGAAGACLAWLAERLNRRGILQFLSGPANSRAQDAAGPHRPRLTGYFFGQTAMLCVLALLAALLGATLSQVFPPGFGMLALFAAPCLWLSLRPLAGMQLRDQRRQAAGEAPVLISLRFRPRRPRGRFAPPPKASAVLFGILLPTIVCVCLFVGGLLSFR